MHTQERSGTHGYMAPEIYSKDGQHSFKSDMFGFGVLIFELATGSRPFSNDFIKEPPKDPEEAARAGVAAGAKLRAAGYPEDLAEFVGRCLQFDPEKRPTSAEALTHPCWRGYTEADFTEKKAPTFFKPRTDVANCDSANLDAEDMFASPSAKPKPSPEEQEKFKDYYYDRSKASPPVGGS
jgi:serine/threonine protein kinase